MGLGALDARLREDREWEALHMAPVASVIINALIVPLALVSWLSLLLGAGDSGELASRGVESLKYYTVLSNLLSAAASAIYLAMCMGGATQLPLWVIVLKLVGAATVMLTFCTVVVLLNPLYGWRKMYRGGNLWLHLILPLLAVVDCCLFVPVARVPFWMTLFAMLATAVYGAFYLVSVRVHGVEEDGVLYDFYGFLRWGWGKVPIVVVCMLLATWGIALAIWLVGGVLGAA